MKFKAIFNDATSWNRKLHIHVGLFLLLFIWLFSFSGLLLNHSQWEFASFWKEREERKIEVPLKVDPGLDSASLIKNVMTQLKIVGEVSNVKLSADSIDFRVTVPGHGRDLHVDLKQQSSTIKEFRFNWWGKMRTLHTFNGVNKNTPETQPNWLVTRVWSLAMDGIALGLIFLCISSWIMWYKIRRNYRWGILVLISGFAAALYFVFLLRFF